MSRKRQSGLLSILAEVRKERHSENIEQLTDAELIARISEGFACDNADAQKLIACGWAIKMRAGDPAKTAELLHKLGIDDCDPGVLAKIHRNPILYEMSTAESYREFHNLNWQHPDAQAAVYIQKIISLALRIGALALG
jgi:hypothetical protein